MYNMLYSVQYKWSLGTELLLISFQPATIYIYNIYIHYLD